MARRRTQRRKISTTYEIMTPESAEEGDVADRGWVNEDGVSMEPDEYDIDEGLDAVDKAVKFLRDEGATEFSGSDWFSWPDWSVVDYRTGEERMQSYHLDGFTRAEFDEIVSRMKERPRRR